MGFSDCNQSYGETALAYVLLVATYRFTLTQAVAPGEQITISYSGSWPTELAGAVSDLNASVATATGYYDSGRLAGLASRPRHARSRALTKDDALA